MLDGGVIAAVAPAAALTVPSDSRAINVKGRTIMPGLIDAHTHLTLIAASTRGSSSR